jgi:hypothetical protein
MNSLNKIPRSRLSIIFRIDCYSTPFGAPTYPAEYARSFRDITHINDTWPLQVAAPAGSNKISSYWYFTMAAVSIVNPTDV